MEAHGNGDDDESRARTGALTESKRDPVVWTAELDAIIRHVRGWHGAQEAINKIQHVHRKWRSHVIWERAKQLGFKRVDITGRATV